MESHIWWKESVVYQIYWRSFLDTNGDGVGDLNGIRQKLGYIKKLGVDILWLCPFFKSPNTDNGYDISDYEALQPEFGTMEDFESFLVEAHSMGLKVVLDLVVNHTSSEHPWFIESCKAEKNAFRDYYIWKKGKPVQSTDKSNISSKEPTNWGSIFSGSAWTYCAETDMYYLHLFSDKQPDLNWKNPEVRKSIFAMMDRWCRKGIDGFRMDVIGMLYKPDVFIDGIVPENRTYGTWDKFIMNVPGVHSYLQEMNKTVLSKYDLVTIGETSGVTPQDALQYAGFTTNELNMVFQFERVDAENENGSKWTEKKIELKKLKDIFSRWQTKLDGKAWNSLYWENHDQPRCISRYGDSGKYWKESAKMLAVCLFMQKGTPYIYQGQELGMCNTHFDSPEQLSDIEAINAYKEMTEEQHKDPTYTMRCINRIGRDNARTPFQWNAEKHAGFTSGTPWQPVNTNYQKINVDIEENDTDSILNFYRTLLRIRKQYPVILYGTYTLLEPAHDKLFVYTRSFAQQETKLLVVCNFSAETVPYHIPQEFSKATVLLSNYTVKQYTHNTEGLVKPYEATVYYQAN